MLVFVEPAKDGGEIDARMDKCLAYSRQIVARGQVRNRSSIKKHGDYKTDGINLFSAHQKVHYTACGWIITVISYLVVLFTLPFSAFFCLKVRNFNNFMNFWKNPNFCFSGCSRIWACSYIPFGSSKTRRSSRPRNIFHYPMHRIFQENRSSCRFFRRPSARGGFGVFSLTSSN